LSIASQADLQEAISLIHGIFLDAVS